MSAPWMTYSVMRRNLRFTSNVAETEEPPLWLESGRADARRNRERLVTAATAAFTARRRTVALETIARDAGVGIGTLYRHFPTREALVEAVYRAELAEVSAWLPSSLKRHPPGDAMRRWMDRYAAFVATKKGMADSLRAIAAAGAVEPNETRESIVSAVGSFSRPAPPMAACGPTCALTTSS